MLRFGAAGEGLFGWLALAGGLHAAAWLCAPMVFPSELRSLAQNLRASMRAVETRIDVSAAEPARAEPPPAPSVVEAPQNVPSPPAPPLVRPPTPVRPSEAAPPDPLATQNHPPMAAAAADAVAKAGKVLTADDLAAIGATISTGDADGVGFGLVAGDGTGDAPTFNGNARIGGKSGGRGKSSKVDAPLVGDKSRPARVIGGFTDECDFPPEADFANIDHAVVTVVVTIKPDGHAASVRVVTDPGHGFGRAAVDCAMGRMYEPARDKTGAPITAESVPVPFRFTR